MKVADIVEQLGGRDTLCRSLGLTTPETITAWIRKGRIPSLRYGAIMRVARKKGISLSFEQLEAAR